MKPSKIAAALCAGLVLAAMLASWSTVVRGADDNDELKKRMAALEAGQRALLKELQEIKTLLQARPAAPPAPSAAAPPPAPAPTGPVSIDNAAIRGNASAKVTLVEFSDFECPFCGRYSRDTLQQIEREYVDTGKLRYAFRNMPLDSIHPHAFKAALAGECARQSGKFWEMHAWLFSHQQALGDADLLKHATTVGVDSGTFQKCVTALPTATKVRQDANDGKALGISGTPAFFIGVMKDGKVRVLQRVSGAKPYAVFKTAIDAVLASPDAR